MILIQLNLDLIQYEVHVIDEDDEMHVVEL
jgi:hypothetical protein